MNEFVSVCEAARLVGLSRFTVSRRIRAGELAVYTGGDRRQRLVRVKDVRRLVDPWPVEQRREGAAR